MNNISAYKSKSMMQKAFNAYDKALKRFPVLYSEKTIESTLGDTYVLSFGKEGAKPLILLHGSAGNSMMWMYNALDLAKSFQVYAIDIVGEAGKSSGNRPSLSSNAYQDWLNEIFEKLNLEKANVCGASFGGVLAHRFAISYPHRIESLILLAPANLYKIHKKFIFKGIMANVIPTKSSAISFLNYMSAAGLHLTNSDIQDFIIQFRAYKPNKNVILTKICSDDELRNLPEKTLILLGDEEVLYNSIQAKHRVEKFSKSAVVQIIKESKHTVSVDQPKVFYDELVNFICGTKL